MLSRSSAFGAAALACLVSACTQTSDVLDSVKTASVRPAAHGAKDRECLARAMFFESRRSSREGLVAVGTVVMNRVNADEYPDTICGVVGQKNQFAPGVLTRGMKSKAMPDVMEAADAVLAGERHPAVHSAKFFHQAGLTFPYKNMHYVLEAGGNAFYEKRSRKRAERPVQQIAQEGQNAIREAAGPALAYEIDPKKADAIGAMLATQKRPERP